jgi:putative flippase GtrA
MLTQMFLNWWSRSALFRFVMMGCVNTGLTYGVYLLLLPVLGYSIAYSLAFVAGIALALMLNAKVVFTTSLQWWQIATYPLIYLVQYLFGLLIVWLAINQLAMSKQLAPLLAIALNIPLTFVLTKLLLDRKRNSR